MPYRPDRVAHFPTLAAMRAPRIAVALAWILLLGIGIAVCTQGTSAMIATAIPIPSSRIHARATAMRGARIAASVGK